MHLKFRDKKCIDSTTKTNCTFCFTTIKVSRWNSENIACISIFKWLKPHFMKIMKLVIVRATKPFNYCILVRTKFKLRRTLETIRFRESKIFLWQIVIYAKGHIISKQIIMKSDNLQYNMLGRWDERLIDQASDVPFFFIISCKNLCKNRSFQFIIYKNKNKEFWEKKLWKK